MSFHRSPLSLPSAAAPSSSSSFTASNTNNETHARHAIQTSKPFVGLPTTRIHHAGSVPHGFLQPVPSAVNSSAASGISVPSPMPIARPQPRVNIQQQQIQYTHVTHQPTYVAPAPYVVSHQPSPQVLAPSPPSAPIPAAYINNRPINASTLMAARQRASLNFQPVSTPSNPSTPSLPKAPAVAPVPRNWQNVERLAPGARDKLGNNDREERKQTTKAKPRQQIHVAANDDEEDDDDEDDDEDEDDSSEEYASDEGDEEEEDEQEPEEEKGTHPSSESSLHAPKIELVFKYQLAGKHTKTPFAYDQLPRSEDGKLFLCPIGTCQKTMPIEHFKKMVSHCGAHSKGVYDNAGRFVKGWSHMRQLNAPLKSFNTTPPRAAAAAAAGSNGSSPSNVARPGVPAGAVRFSSNYVAPTKPSQRPVLHSSPSNSTSMQQASHHISSTPVTPMPATAVTATIATVVTAIPATALPVASAVASSRQYSHSNSSSTAIALPLSRYRVESDDTAICCICDKGDSTDDNQILLCDGPCSMAYHQDCLLQDTSELPEGDWFCSIPCEEHKKKSSPSPNDEEEQKESSPSPSPPSSGLTESQMGAHIQMMRAARVARLNEEKEARIARLNARFEAGKAMKAPIDRDASLAKVKSCDELWNSTAAYFDEDKLAQSKKLLDYSQADATARFMPELGAYYKALWMEEDDDAGVPKHLRSYFRPARGTERHDAVEFEHYYEEYAANDKDNAAAGRPDSPSHTPTSIAASPTKTGSNEEYSFVSPIRPNVSVVTATAEASPSAASALASPSTAAAGLLIRSPSASSTSSALPSPSSVPVFTKLRSRVAQSQNMRRIGQTPVRVSWQFLLTNKPDSALSNNPDTSPIVVPMPLSRFISAVYHNTTADAALEPDTKLDAKAIEDIKLALKHNDSLLSIAMDGCGLNDELFALLVEGFTEKSSIQRYSFQQNSIGDVGAAALARYLEDKSSVNSINLSSNRIGNEGASSLSQLIAQNSCVKLQLMYLNDNPIEETGAMALLTGIQSNSTITRMYLSLSSASVTPPTPKFDISAIEQQIGKLIESRSEREKLHHAAAEVFNRNNQSTAVVNVSTEESDTLLPCVSAPPLHFFSLRAMDVQYARETGELQLETNALLPPAAYHFDNQLLQKHLAAKAAGEDQESIEASKHKKRVSHGGDGAHEVVGPFSGHYTFPILHSSMVNNELTEAQAADSFFRIPPTLFDSELVECKEGVKVHSVDFTASANPHKLDASVTLDPDEVSSALWLARRELLEQINANNQRKKNILNGCNKEKAFDSNRLQLLQQQKAFESKTLIAYQQAFPSSYSVARDYEHEQSAVAAIAQAASRAGKSIATAAHTKVMSAMSAEEREAVRLQRKRELNKKYRERLKLEAAAKKRRARQRGDDDYEEEEDADEDASDEESEEEDEDDSDSESDYEIDDRGKRSLSHFQSSPMRSAVGGKAPRSSAAPRNGNVIVIPRPRHSARDLKLQQEQVRLCLDHMITTVEQLDRVSTITKSKSVKIQQLRERREKRQKDLKQLDEERRFKGEVRSVLGALVSQVEINAENPQHPAASIFASISNTEEDSTTASVAVVIRATASTSVAMDTSADAAAVVPVADSMEISMELVDESSNAAADATNAAANASATVSRAPTPAAAISSPANPLLPHPSLYTDFLFCHRPRCNGAHLYRRENVYLKCDECDLWFHVRCMGLLEESLTRLYRFYCKSCQTAGHTNVNISESARRYKRSKQEAMPTWGNAAAKSDAAVSLHLDGMDDAERLEREEEDEEKHLRFVYLAERHQGVLLVDESGAELNGHIRKPKKEIEIDEDEIAVMNDPTPWEWPTVRLKRLIVCRVPLTKVRLARRGQVAYESTKPVEIEETYFQTTKAGLREFQRAKFLASIPTRTKWKIQNRHKLGLTSGGRTPASSRMPTDNPCPDCSFVSRSASGLAVHVRSHHTLYDNGDPLHSKEIIDVRTAPKWNRRNSTINRKRTRDEDGSPLGDEVGDDPMDVGELPIDEDDDEMPARQLPESPARHVVSVSRSGRQVKRFVLTTNRSVAKPVPAEGAMDETLDAAAEAIDEAGPMSKAAKDQRRAKRKRRIPRRDLEDGQEIAPIVVIDEKNIRPLPTFANDRKAFARVEVRRAHEHSNRIKLKLRVSKTILSDEVKQDMPIVQLNIEPHCIDDVDDAMEVSDEASSSFNQTPLVRVDVAPHISRHPDSSESDECESSDSDQVEQENIPGCMICGKLSRESKIILCDGCDGEVHYDCAKLARMPKEDEDFDCHECKRFIDHFEAAKERKQKKERYAAAGRQSKLARANARMLGTTAHIRAENPFLAKFFNALNETWPQQDFEEAMEASAKADRLSQSTSTDTAVLESASPAVRIRFSRHAISNSRDDISIAATTAVAITTDRNSASSPNQIHRKRGRPKKVEDPNLPQDGASPETPVATAEKEPEPAEDEEREFKRRKTRSSGVPMEEVVEPIKLRISVSVKKEKPQPPVIDTAATNAPTTTTIDTVMHDADAVPEASPKLRSGRPRAPPVIVNQVAVSSASTPSGDDVPELSSISAASATSSASSTSCAQTTPAVTPVVLSAKNALRSRQAVTATAAAAVVPAAKPQSQPSITESAESLDVSIAPVPRTLRSRRSETPPTTSVTPVSEKSSASTSEEDRAAFESTFSSVANGFQMAEPKVSARPSRAAANAAQHKMAMSALSSSVLQKLDALEE